MKHLIVRSNDGKTFTAYNEVGVKVCSDTNYEDCVIKLGLLGHEMNPIPENSFAAEQIRMKIEYY